MLARLFLFFFFLVPNVDSYLKTPRFSRKFHPHIKAVSKVEITESVPLAEWKPITKDGNIRKLIIRKSSTTSSQRILEAGDVLAIEYSGRIEGATQPFASDSKAKFVFQDGTMIKGWDIAVGSMKIGEKARFRIDSRLGYGEKGVPGVIPPNANLEFEIALLGWLGNQMKPETMFKSDLELDPFLATTPEQIQADFNDRLQTKAVEDRFQGNMLQIYWRRIKSMSIGFAGSSFFRSTSGEASPWYLNPLITFPSMAVILVAAFLAVMGLGGVREKGFVASDLDSVGTSLSQPSTSPSSAETRR